MARHQISGDAAIRAVKAGDPRARLTDGDGLFVKGGSHGWRIDYTFGGKRNTLSLGTYPDVGLAAARRRAEEIRGLVADGVDPSGARKSEVLKQRTEEARVDAGLAPSGIGSFGMQA